MIEVKMGAKISSSPPTLFTPVGRDGMIRERIDNDFEGFSDEVERQGQRYYSEKESC